MEEDTMLETRTAPSVKSAPVETVTPIRGSEAIRLGCLAFPVQAFGHAFEGANGACAIGAMSAGLGGSRVTFPQGLWETLSNLPCPLGCVKRGRVWADSTGPATPAHLNDDHRWSRERIADWLEGLGL